MPPTNQVPSPSVPPIPERVRPAVAWISWALMIAGPTAGALIPRLTTGTTREVLIQILGLLVSVAVALKGGLSNPFAAAKDAPTEKVSPAATTPDPPPPNKRPDKDDDPDLPSDPPAVPA